VDVVRRKHPDVTHLRDVTPEMLDECREDMDATLFRRCGFVVRENARVLKACEALDAKDVAACGSLLYESHDGLRLDYEVSCPELDVLVDAVRELPAVYGARMMGGGFGGCTINLTGREEAAFIGKTVRDAYRKRFRVEPKMYVTTIGTGTHVVNGENDAQD
jgi:galactokinase